MGVLANRLRCPLLFVILTVQKQYVILVNIANFKNFRVYVHFRVCDVTKSHCSPYHLDLFKMAPLCSDAVQVAPLRLCFYLLFYLLLPSLFTHTTSALITYDKLTLLDIGHRYTNLFQDTLSPNPSWPFEILRNAEENNGHRRRIKKHRGKRAGIRNRLRKRAHSPPLPNILLTNVQSLENKMDDLRARISFQRDIIKSNHVYCHIITAHVP